MRATTKHRVLGRSNTALLYLLTASAALIYWGTSFRGSPTPNRDHEVDASSGVRPELALGRSAEYDYDPPEPGTYELPVIKQAGDGAVLGTDGERRGLRDLLDGQITVLSFIYTRCADPTACPYATSVLSDIQSVTRKDRILADNLRLITLSFDPEHDTPRVMSEYEEFVHEETGARWLFLTTATRKELAPILAHYGQQVDRKKDADDPLGPFYHMLRVYLIDRRGMIRNIYSTGLLDPRLVVTDVRTLLLEEETARTTIAR